MPKKILDIFPPKEPPITFWEDKFKQGIQIKPAKQKKMVRSLVILILIGILCYFIPPYLWGRAEIEIWPKTELQTFKTELTASSSVILSNISNKTIPGKIFENEKTISQEFPSSGKIYKKAEGVIRVYNNSSSSETLAANTRFCAPLEKFQPSLEQGENPWFRALEKITIPAKGYKDVKVRADSAGEKYNIGPSTFSIPGLFGTPQYTLIYGKSSESMSGGGEISQVTEKDLEGAKNVLVEKITEECQTSLKNEIPSEFKLLDGTAQTKIIESSSLTKAGDELATFNFQVKAKSLGLAFKELDTKNLAQDFISSQIPEDKKLYQESLEIKYLPKTTNLDDTHLPASGKMTISLEMTGKIYSDINQKNLKEELLGKSLPEAQTILNNQSQITKTKVKFQPFWLRKVPKNIEKIEVKLKFD